MLRRKRLSGFAKFILAGLLFAHAAVAIAGCDFSQRSAAKAVAAVVDTLCADHGTTGVLDGNANLCLVDCTSDAQNVDTAGLTFHSFAWIAVLTVSPAPVHRCLAIRHPSFTGYAFAAPPLSILFQNFRV